MLWASKHGKREEIKNLSDLSGGLNLSTNQENIADNELWVADNWEYDQQSGALKVADGLESRFNAAVPVEALFYDPIHSCWVFSSGTSFYTTDLSTKTLIGSLAGAERPTFAPFGTKLLVASGSGLQEFDGSTLSAISDAPDTSLVKDKGGRVLSFSLSSDRMTQSAVGDHTDWDTTLTGDSDAKYLDIGYKDPGRIIAVGFLSDDVVVWKASGRAYRIVGEYPDWVVKEITRDADCIAPGAVVGMGNYAMFLGKGGLQTLETVQAYGDMKLVDQFGLKINPMLVRNVDTAARLWHVPSKKQVWVKGQNDKTVWFYHYQGDRYTRRKFPYNINDVVSKGTETYVACGNYICKLNRGLDADLGETLTATLEGKRFSSSREFLIKKVTMEGYCAISGSGAVSFGNITIPFTASIGGDIAYLDTDVAYLDTDPLISSSFFRVQSNNKRTRTRATSLRVITGGGSISLRNIFVNIVEV